MKQVLLLFLLILSAVPAQTSLSHQRPAPQLNLFDQYDRPHSFYQPGTTTLLLASDREGEAETVRWRMKLIERYASAVVVLGVADVRGVPFFLKRAVKNNFKKYPAPVLLDWEGTLFSEMELSPGIPNIVLIDETGQARLLYSGETNYAACNFVFEEIDRALRIRQGKG